MSDKLKLSDVERVAKLRYRSTHLTASLKEMVERYGETDGAGPNDLITRAVKAIRLVDPKYKFEDY